MWEASSEAYFTLMRCVLGAVPDCIALALHFHQRPKHQVDGMVADVWRSGMYYERRCDYFSYFSTISCISIFFTFSQMDGYFILVQKPIERIRMHFCHIIAVSL